ncbi:molecular chaperone TorD [Dankookia rubra]|uniref:Molecular chaperone TorD n=1 Tax=Dankookia rubra TaxID=1442381 RepID=A0A4R5QBM7_9PROT|nr:molecular chaperone TorD family protein [Dankookia rubra]TDH59989.1 molecular chaperone TorD [Dankookia rubra]
MAISDTAQRDSVEAERAQLFGLLARLLSAVPDAGLLRSLAGLAGDASPVGLAIGGLARAAAAAAPAALDREFFDLFTGVGRGELLPYASYYLTGFLHERPLAELRGDLARLGIARTESVAEPEDHIAFLCETLAGLIEGRLGPPEEAAPFFARHMRPWAARCFADLERAEAAKFYRSVGTLGRVAVEIEQAAAELPQ